MRIDKGCFNKQNRAVEKKIKRKVWFRHNPGSEQNQVYAERDGYCKNIRNLGATVLLTACGGPCIGQWDRSES